MLISFADLVKQAFELVRNRAKTLLPLCVIGTILTFLGAGLGLAPYPLIAGILGAGSPLAYFICALLALSLGLIASLWIQLALAVAVMHPEAGFRLALSATRDRIWSFVGMGLVAFLLIGGGFSLFILPGLLFCVWFFAFPFVQVVDGLSGFDALLKSREYVRGRELGILLRLVVLGLVATLLGLIPLAGLLLGPAFLAAGTGILFQNLKSLQLDMPFAASSRQKILYSAVAAAGFLGLGFAYAKILGNPFSRQAPLDPPALRQDATVPAPPSAAVKAATPAPKAVPPAAKAVPAPAKPAATAASSQAPKVKKAQNKDGGVLLSWDPVPGSSGYHVFVSSGKGFKQVTAKPLAKTSVKLAKLKPGQTYEVKLAAVQGGRTGPMGPLVRVKGATAAAPGRPGDTALKPPPAKK